MKGALSAIWIALIGDFGRNSVKQPVQHRARHGVVSEDHAERKNGNDLRCEVRAEAVCGADVFDDGHAGFPEGESPVGDQS